MWTIDDGPKAMILRVFPLLEIKHITDLNVYTIDFVVLIISISDISIDLIATTFQTTQERSCERENTGACVSFHCFVEHKKTLCNYMRIK